MTDWPARFILTHCEEEALGGAEPPMIRAGRKASNMLEGGAAAAPRRVQE